MLEWNRKINLRIKSNTCFDKGILYICGGWVS